MVKVDMDFLLISEVQGLQKFFSRQVKFRRQVEIFYRLIIFPGKSILKLNALFFVDRKHQFLMFPVHRSVERD